MEEKITRQSEDSLAINHYYKVREYKKVSVAFILVSKSGSQSNLAYSNVAVCLYSSITT